MRKALLLTQNAPAARSPGQVLLLGYALAVLSVGIALGLTFLTHAHLQEKSLFMLFFVSVAVSASIGGLGPGVVATFLSAFTCEFFLFPPLYTFAIERKDQIPLALYTLSGLLVSALSELLHIARRTAHQEIAERKQTEEMLRQKQEEIEALNRRLQQSIRETHHRVKNHLQVLSSQVDMQMLTGMDTLPAEAFQELGKQMRTLALIHDLLAHGSEDEEPARAVSAQTLLNQLLGLIRQTIGVRPLHCEIAEARLTGIQGTGLARVVNELVSNAIKHSDGPVDVTFSVQRGQGCLSVCDEGPGFPAGFDPAKASHIGLDLVESICKRDLGGHVRYENRSAGGAQVVLTFPLAKA
ncbi:MAG TPA: DUF4118 domain-containing protein [Chthonomonadaceae bacterium]|nr:DUF4118 domain-containing protein [Chthonomonadaceae bacterium]